MKTRYTRSAAGLLQDAIIQRTRYFIRFRLVPTRESRFELKQPTSLCNHNILTGLVILFNYAAPVTGVRLWGQRDYNILKSPR